MVRRLINITTEEDRKKALASTQRLADFHYSDNHMDAPTPKEAEKEQEEAEEIQYLHLERYHRVNDLLNNAEYADTIWKRAHWLGKLGYNGVNVKGYSKPIPFNVALEVGYTRNICRMFENERKRLEEMRDESSRYAFLRSNHN